MPQSWHCSIAVHYRWQRVAFGKENLTSLDIGWVPSFPTHSEEVTNLPPLSSLPQQLTPLIMQQFMQSPEGYFIFSFYFHPINFVFWWITLLFFAFWLTMLHIVLQNWVHVKYYLIYIHTFVSIRKVFTWHSLKQESDVRVSIVVPIHWCHELHHLQ